jgi:hypothetical protein
LLKAIESCEKHEFDKVVKTYLREIYGFETIVNTDGPGDSGIDIQVFNVGGQNIQYQVSTQMSESQQEQRAFNKKILADFAKSKDNTKKGYSNILYFFYSKKLTNRSISSFKTIALKDYGLNLEMIEANRIADEAENYIELQRDIINFSELDKIQFESKSFSNTEKNLVFELIGFGKPAELRFQIIEAFIIQVLFNNTQLSREQIIEQSNTNFKTKENNIFYEKLLNRLMTEKRVTKTEDKTKFRLTDIESKKISELYKKFDLENQLFTKDINAILINYDQDKYINDYVNELKKIYTENFNSDLTGVIEDAISVEITGISYHFKTFIESKISNKQSAKQLAIELLKYCQTNKFLQKYCASKVFSEKTNLQRLELYVNSKKRIFIDTQIALHVLCYFFKKDCNYENYFFQVSKGLLEFSRANNTPLFIFERYLWEVQTHVRQALNLIPFTSLPNFNSLGKSRNVFYNFFLFLNEHCLTESKTFEDFLRSAGFNIKDSFKINGERIDYYFNQIGIQKVGSEKEYDIEDVKRLFTKVLNDTQKNKALFSLNNDAIMVEFLADNDVDVHPLEPIFVTWDKSFLKVREQYYKNHPTSQRWFLFTPSKLIDHYSVLRFSIDSETVTRDLLALLTDEIITKTHILLDSLTVILNPHDEIGLEYTNKFAQIRDEEIHRISSNEIEALEVIEGETALDEVMFQVTNYFFEDAEKQNYFKKIFLEKDLIDPVFEIIQKSISRLYEHKLFDTNTFAEFEELISRIKEEEKQRITSQQPKPGGPSDSKLAEGK